jgi:hypothetical protein
VIAHEDWWNNFQSYLQNTPVRILECRISGHRWPDWSDHKRTKLRRESTGTFILEIQCLRKCGTNLTRFISPDGYLARNNYVRYDYEGGYVTPKDARSGKGRTTEMRAAERLELIERNSEWITQED